MRFVLPILLIFTLSQGLRAEEPVQQEEDLPQWSHETFVDGNRSKVKSFVNSLMPEEKTRVPAAKTPETDAPPEP
jgi:hypothetical protein